MQIRSVASGGWSEGINCRGAGGNCSVGVFYILTVVMFAQLCTFVQTQALPLKWYVYTILLYVYYSSKKLFKSENVAVLENEKGEDWKKWKHNPQKKKQDSSLPTTHLGGITVFIRLFWKSKSSN